VPGYRKEKTGVMSPSSTGKGSSTNFTLKGKGKPSGPAEKKAVAGRRKRRKRPVAKESESKEN